VTAVLDEAIVTGSVHPTVGRTGRFAAMRRLSEGTMAAGEESERAAADVYAELSALVGALAHEIRNPLSTIRLNMELLAEDFPAEEPPADHPAAAGSRSTAQMQRDRRARAKIDLVRHECDRLEKLLGDFLDFARRESPAFEPGNLNAEVGQLLDFFAPRAAEAGVEVIRYLDPELPGVLLDRDSFRSAILNILLNAIQAMQPLQAGGQLVVRTRPSGRGVLLEVIDTGPGMDEETLAKAFRAFFTTKQGGSGLGLPTTRKIVEAHGGSIDVESALGRGTKVAIWLPAPQRLAGSG
jgi:signal transduction histidine kinase